MKKRYAILLGILMVVSSAWWAGAGSYTLGTADTLDVSGKSRFGTASGAGQVNITPASAIVGLNVDMGNFNAKGISIHANGNENALYLLGKYGAYFEQDVIGGRGLHVKRNLGSTDDTFPLATFLNDNAANTMPTLFVNHKGTGGATGYGLHVDSENAVGPAAKIDTVASGISLDLSTAGFMLHSMTTGITAVNPGAQGDGALTTSYNHVTTVGTADDAVTLPTAVAGLEVNIRNDGANQLEIWPASSDDAGGGVDTAVTLAVGAAATYVAIDATTWKIW
jgi:hypothetical protein